MLFCLATCASEGVLGNGFAFAGVVSGGHVAARGGAPGEDEDAMVDFLTSADDKKTGVRVWVLFDFGQTLQIDAFE